MSRQRYARLNSAARVPSALSANTPKTLCVKHFSLICREVNGAALE